MPDETPRQRRLHELVEQIARCGPAQTALDHLRDFEALAETYAALDVEKRGFGPKQD
jgi:hypothetical protein